MPSRTLLFLAAAVVTGGCATPETPAPPAREEIVAVTVSNHLLRFNAGQPQAVRERRPLTGLRPGERLLGIDYRVARGELHALGASGQLYRIDVARAAASAVGNGVALPAGGVEWGFDFNPAADRIRVVSDNSLNLRMHPDTGELVDSDASQPGVQSDGRLAYEDGRPGTIVAAGYTYNQLDDKLTTNYALDGAAGTLVSQGTQEGLLPAVSPNTGRLFAIGSLGVGTFAHATLDISDVSNTAYAGLRAAGAGATRWHRIDPATGRARFIGTVGGGEPLAGAAIEP